MILGWVKDGVMIFEVIPKDSISVGAQAFGAIYAAPSGAADLFGHNHRVIVSAAAKPPRPKSTKVAHMNIPLEYPTSGPGPYRLQRMHQLTKLGFLKHFYFYRVD